MKEKLPLSTQDIKKLRKHLLPTLLFPFVAAAMFYAFFSIFFKDTDNGILQDDISIYILVGFSVFFFSIIGYMIWGYAIDLRRGFKYRIEGKITDKKLSVTTSRTNNTKTGSSSSSTSRYYSLCIDGVQYPIESQHYGKIKVGNTVTMEKAPKSNVTLLLELKDSDKISQEKPIEGDTDTKEFLGNMPKKVPFGQADFKALKSGFKAKIKTRLLWFLPPASIALLLMLNGMQAFFIVLFPLVLIPGYQVWKLSREFLQYNRNKQYAYKAGIPAIVEDKSKYSYNGKSSNNVSTSYGQLKVSEQVYDKLNPGDKIILYKPATGKQILSVLTTNKEEHYLM